MEFFLRAASRSASAVLFPGAFNPPTRAHLALAAAALSWAPEVVFVLPRRFPHKDYAGPSFDERLDLLIRAAAEHPAFSVAGSDAGLFIHIARAARIADPALRRLLILCGRDAAERIVSWDYGEADALSRHLEEYELLVAPRAGAYQPPPALAGRIHSLEIDGCDEVSATDVRDRIRRGLPVDTLVPHSIARRVHSLYG
jgi:nicotinate-nucleotide adenylyltransferase